jgi:hypothetical protein
MIAVAGSILVLAAAVLISGGAPSSSGDRAFANILALVIGVLGLALVAWGALGPRRKTDSAA